VSIVLRYCRYVCAQGREVFVERKTRSNKIMLCVMREQGLAV
jgi:hypothetical protein